MPAIAANGIKIYYEVHGAGEPLVLIAGLNSDHTLFERTYVSDPGPQRAPSGARSTSLPNSIPRRPRRPMTYCPLMPPDT